MTDTLTETADNATFISFCNSPPEFLFCPKLVHLESNERATSIDIFIIFGIIINLNEIKSFAFDLLK